MRVDPSVDQTGAPYAYAGDDPVIERDLNGLAAVCLHAAARGATGGYEYGRNQRAITNQQANGNDNWAQDLNSELSSISGRASYAYYSFSSIGLTPTQAAALTGSLFEESAWTMAAGVRQGGCTPDFAHPSPSTDCGRGIAQWGVYDRWPAMRKAEGGDSFVGETDYVYVEMKQRGDWRELMQTHTMTTAMNVVVNDYEQAGFANTSCRTNTARNILHGKFGVPGAGC